MDGDPHRAAVRGIRQELLRPRPDHAVRWRVPAVQGHHGAARTPRRPCRPARRQQDLRAVLADRRADRGARRGVLARRGDHRGGHGRAPGSDDDRGDRLHRPDDRRQQAADPLRQSSPDGDHAVPGLPDDDRLQPDRRGPGLPYPERLPVRGHRLLDPHRGVQPGRPQAPQEEPAGPPPAARAYRPCGAAPARRPAPGGRRGRRGSRRPVRGGRRPGGLRPPRAGDDQRRAAIGREAHPQPDDGTRRGRLHRPRQRPRGDPRGAARIVLLAPAAGARRARRGAAGLRAQEGTAQGAARRRPAGPGKPGPPAAQPVAGLLDPRPTWPSWSTSSANSSAC